MKRGVRAMGIYNHNGRLVFVSQDGASENGSVAVLDIVQLDKYKSIESGIICCDPLTKEKLLELGKLLMSYNELAKGVSMRIRPYIESRDYKYIEKWIGNERNHALWCANLIPYPVTKENLRAFLAKTALEYTDSAYVATEINGKIIGFFCYSINVNDNTGFFKFVIVDHSLRGKGHGGKMLKLALQYAFEITGVKLVQLNVFDENVIAKHCYEKVGFIVESITQNAFRYKNESWSRCHMIITK